MSTGTGVNVSKAIAYTVLTKPAGVNVSKSVSYTVLTKPAGVNVSKSVSYTVLTPSNSNPPVWPNFTFANGVVGNVYSQQWDLTPAAAPTTYTVTAGALPDGLTLTNVGGDIGKISGTPTVAATFSFTLTASNVAGSQPKSFSITIKSSSSGSASAYGWSS